MRDIQRAPSLQADEQPAWST